MERRNLGNTGLVVTALGYGAWELRHLELHDAKRVLSAVLDGGINYIDTCPDYGPSEAYIGAALSHRRNEFFLATKCGCNIDESGQRKDPAHIWNRSQLSANIENSLKVLKTDHIDVWQLHNAQPEDLAGGRTSEAIETMLKLKQQGKIRCIGVSFKNGRPTHEWYPAGFGFHAAREFMQWGVFDVMQVVYGGLIRQNELVISQASAQGLGIIVRGALRKYHSNYDELFTQARLDELCTENESRSDFLIRFALTHTGIGSMIVGTRAPAHLAANIRAAAKGRLSDEVYREAKKRLDAVGLIPGQPAIVS